MSSPTSNDFNDEESNTNGGDQSQRKRTRVRSHPDDEATRRNETPSQEDPPETDQSKKNEKEENRKSNARAKRQRLHVEIDEMVNPEETTNDSTQTTTNDTGSREASPSTDEDEDEDEDEEDDDDEDDDTDTDDEDESQFKPPILPPTKNLYSILRQREYGIFRRMHDRSTCRAFHDQIIASRTIVQKMKISHTLLGHDGCVNALSFNRTGW